MEHGLAIVTCVRNEARFLRPFLAYHHALGVGRAYVYLDRCTDASARIVRDFPWAEPIPGDRGDAPCLVHQQLRAANDALARARAERIEWLLSLDVDEFAWGENPGDLELFQAGSLLRMLARAQTDTEMVVLRTLEVIPERLPPGAPFWQLQRVLETGGLDRVILDPTTGDLRRLSGCLGHRLGKSAVRVAADVQAGTSHVWTRPQDRRLPDLVPLPNENLGRHLHFVAVDASHWQAKYKKLSDDPPRWPRGRPVGFPKQAWKEAAPRMSDDEARAYFERWVAVPEDIVASAPGVSRRSQVADVLRRLGLEDAEPA